MNKELYVILMNISSAIAKLDVYLTNHPDTDFPSSLLPCSANEYAYEWLIQANKAAGDF
jgi:hypothetical protein